jgi:hypothetical protein
MRDKGFAFLPLDEDPAWLQLRALIARVESGESADSVFKQQNTYQGIAGYWLARAIIDVFDKTGAAVTREEVKEYLIKQGFGPDTPGGQLGLT